MGNELSTSAVQQDWSEEQVAAQLEAEALFDFDRFLASLTNPPPRTPSSRLCVDTEASSQTIYVNSTSSSGIPVNANRPPDSFRPPDEMSLTSCRHIWPMVPTQHPSAVTTISGGSTSNMQATSVSVLLPMSLKMPPLDVSSPHHMQPPGPPAQAPTLPADTISFQTPIPQDEHPHVPVVAPELTPLGTKALARESLTGHPHDVLKASGAPGSSAGTPVYQPMPNVDQVSLHFVSTPSVKVCLTHRVLCLCRDIPINASTLRNRVCGCRRARSCATSFRPFGG